MGLEFPIEEDAVTTATASAHKSSRAQGASPFLSRPAWSRYTLAIGITAFVTLARLALDRWLTDHSIYSFYFVPVILAAWYCGLGPSIMNVALGAGIASFAFASPRGSFWIADVRHQFGLAVFCIIGSYLAYVIHWLNQDIACRKQVEADLLASQEQLELHQGELAHMARLSIMGEMTATLAHELNQPLHAAKNYACGSVRRLLKDPDHDAELLSVLKRIGEEADRAAKILRRVRDFIEKTGPHKSEISLNNTIHDALSIINLEVKRTRAKVVCELASEIAAVKADPIQIEQVVVNLARNGLDSMQDIPEDQRVLLIGTRQSDAQTVEVYVRDRGKGLSGDEANRIFEPFFTTKPDGMGMGLAISRSIIQSHEGRLWVSPNQDRGCTFQFALPAFQEE
jgi:signal transduction histidine kinase